MMLQEKERTKVRTGGLFARDISGPNKYFPTKKSFGKIASLFTESKPNTNQHHFLLCLTMDNSTTEATTPVTTAVTTSVTTTVTTTVAPDANATTTTTEFVPAPHDPVDLSGDSPWPIVVAVLIGVQLYILFRLAKKTGCLRWTWKKVEIKGKY